jgi:thioesterase domain-containing protein
LNPPDQRAALRTIREIRSVQPHGPYCLAGHSFGGYPVFEMAQQLHADGEAVALVSLLDTIESQYVESFKHPTDFRQKWTALQQRWAQRLQRLVKVRRDYLKDLKAKAVARILRKLGKPIPQRIGNLREINRYAMSQYQPAVYPGQLIIFRSLVRGFTSDTDEQNGWGGLVSGGIEVHDVPGGHEDMLFEPHVRLLAQKLRACLDRVQEVKLQHPISEAAVDMLEPAQIPG